MPARGTHSGNNRVAQRWGQVCAGNIVVSFRGCGPDVSMQFHLGMQLSPDHQIAAFRARPWGSEYRARLHYVSPVRNQTYQQSSSRRPSLRDCSNKCKLSAFGMCRSRRRAAHDLVPVALLPCCSVARRSAVWASWWARSNSPRLTTRQTAGRRGPVKAAAPGVQRRARHPEGLALMGKRTAVGSQGARGNARSRPSQL